MTSRCGRRLRHGVGQAEAGAARAQLEAPLRAPLPAGRLRRGAAGVGVPRGGSGRLGRNRDFLLLWTGVSVSAVGSRITALAALLTAATPLGPRVDRLPKRAVPAAVNAASGLLPLLVPAATVDGSLRHRTRTYAVALLCAALQGPFDLAYQAFLPGLAGRRRLVEGPPVRGFAARSRRGRLRVIPASTSPAPASRRPHAGGRGRPPRA